MQFSLMTYTVHAGQPGGLETLEEMADFAAELDFAALELSARDLTEREPEEIAAVCVDRGLEVSCINGPADVASADDAEFNRGVGAGRELADAAAAMGCPTIMVIPGRAEGPGDLDRAAERIAEGLSLLVEHGAKVGVQVTIEDFPNPLAPYASIEQVQRLLDDAPGLRLTFDSGNWLVGGDDPVEALRALSDAVVNCHIKDWEPDPAESRIQLPDGRWIRGGLHGEGMLDHRAVLSALLEMDYDGFAAFEYEGVMDHAEATRRGIAYLREVLDELRGG